MDLIQRKTVPGTDRDLGTALQDSGSADSGLWIGLLADIDSGSGTGFWGRCGSQLQGRTLESVRIQATGRGFGAGADSGSGRGLGDRVRIQAPGQGFGIAHQSRPEV